MCRTQTLSETIIGKDSGPGISTEIVPAPGTSGVIMARVDASHPYKAHTFLRWLDEMSVWDMVAGKYRASDRLLRLNIRGQLADGIPVIVVAEFNEDTEHEQTELIRCAIEKQRPLELLRQLVAIEARKGRGAR